MKRTARHRPLRWSWCALAAVLVATSLAHTACAAAGVGVAGWSEDVFHDRAQRRAASLVAAPGPYGLMLVVGQVEGSTARILYEGDPGSPLTTAGAEFTVQVWGRRDAWGHPDRFLPPTVGLRGDPDSTLVVTPIAEPQVLLLTGLAADTQHVVRFTPTVPFEGTLAHPQAHEVVFSTMTPSADLPLRIVALACDRFTEDHDSTLVERLAAQARTPRGFDVVVHMGDQIYADWLVEPFMNASYDVVLEQFRRYYRLAWTRPSMRAILRRGSHLMLPDDHDVTNSLSEVEWAQHRVFVEAAQRAFYEYQLQLRRDIPPRDAASASVPLEQAKQATLAVHSFLVLRGTAMALLDMRWQRTFNLDAAAPFLGSQQLVDVDRVVAGWSNDESVRRLAVFSSLPLLYQGLWPAELADFVENEKYSTADEHEAETLRLLRTLRDAMADKPKLFLAGDLHMFLDSTICSSSPDDLSTTCARQLVTSGLTSSATTVNALDLTLYTMLTLHLWPSTLGEFTATFHDIFLSQNYLSICAACPTSPGPPPLWSGSEGAAGQGFTWRSERVALRPSHRLWHAFHDTSSIVVPCVLLFLALVLFVLASCCWRRCCRRGPAARASAKTRKRKLT